MEGDSETSLYTVCPNTHQLNQLRYLCLFNKVGIIQTFIKISSPRVQFATPSLKVLIFLYLNNTFKVVSGSIKANTQN